jgi:hypothetical protein
VLVTLAPTVRTRFCRRQRRMRERCSAIGR